MDPGTAADRISRHILALAVRAVEGLDENDRSTSAVDIAESLIRVLASAEGEGTLDDIPERPARVLRAIRSLRLDGTPKPIDSPLTPLLDTTVLTNAPGEPSIG